MPGSLPSPAAPVSGYGWRGPAATPARRPQWPALPVRARADGLLIGGAVAGGLGFDLAARTGLATLAATGWVIIVAGSLLLSRRIRGRVARVCLGAAMLLGVLLSVRSNAYVIVPVAAAIALLLILGASLGADGSGPATTFAALAGRLGIAGEHLLTAPGMLRVPGGAGPARQRAIAAARGAVVAAPIVLVIGVLLATADPIFASWFDVPALARHLVLIAAGSWIVLGLGRASSAQRPAPELRPPPALGIVEAAVPLAALSALYGAFAGAQLEALSGAGHRILVTRGLTYSQYARTGFFQLLACAAITLLVLLGVRACTRPAPAITGLCALTTVLTLGVVVAAVQRLQLYAAAYGLTLLRLACLAAAAWIGVVFLLLAACLTRRGLPARYFPAAVLISGLVAVASWGISDPAAIVATTNLARAAHGKPFDVSQAAGLGPDAAPALVSRLPDLTRQQAGQLRHMLCQQTRGRGAGLAFNVSRHSARDAMTGLCGPGR